MEPPTREVRTRASRLWLLRSTRSRTTSSAPHDRAGSACQPSDVGSAAVQDVLVDRGRRGRSAGRRGPDACTPPTRARGRSTCCRTPRVWRSSPRQALSASRDSGPPTGSWSRPGTARSTGPTSREWLRRPPDRRHRPGRGVHGVVHRGHRGRCLRPRPEGHPGPGRHGLGRPDAARRDARPVAGAVPPVRRLHPTTCSSDDRLTRTLARRRGRGADGRRPGRLCLVRGGPGPDRGRRLRQRRPRRRRRRRMRDAGAGDRRGARAVLGIRLRGGRPRGRRRGRSAGEHQHVSGRCRRSATRTTWCSSPSSTTAGGWSRRAVRRTAAGPTTARSKDAEMRLAFLTYLLVVLAGVGYVIALGLRHA